MRANVPRTSLFTEFIYLSVLLPAARAQSADLSVTKSRPQAFPLEGLSHIRSR
jgi:hypothetical protein